MPTKNENTQLLKRLREEHAGTVNRTRELLKERQKVYKKIRLAIKDESKTVPALGEALEMLPHEVLWYITAMKKYGTIAEDGMSGEYVLYKLKEEKG